jgi:hypothetical protein
VDPGTQSVFGLSHPRVNVCSCNKGYFGNVCDKLACSQEPTLLGSQLSGSLSLQNESALPTYQNNAACQWTFERSVIEQVMGQTSQGVRFFVKSLHLEAADSLTIEIRAQNNATLSYSIETVPLSASAGGDATVCTEATYCFLRAEKSANARTNWTVLVDSDCTCYFDVCAINKVVRAAEAGSNPDSRSQAKCLISGAAPYWESIDVRFLSDSSGADTGVQLEYLAMPEVFDLAFKQPPVNVTALIDLRGRRVVLRWNRLASSKLLSGFWIDVVLARAKRFDDTALSFSVHVDNPNATSYTLYLSSNASSRAEHTLLPNAMYEVSVSAMYSSFGKSKSVEAVSALTLTSHEICIAEATESINASMTEKCCKPEEFQDTDFVCKPCPTNAFCGGGPLWQMRALQGCGKVVNFPVTLEETFVECPNPSVCLGPVDQTDSSTASGCASPHTGEVCSNCEPAFHQTSRHECTPCVSKESWVLYFVLYTLAIVFLGTFLTIRRVKNAWYNVRRVQFHYALSSEISEGMLQSFVSNMQVCVCICVRVCARV